MQEASKVHQSRTKGLTWNGASIATIALDCIVILKILDYMSRALIDRILRQILATTRGEFVSQPHFGLSVRVKPTLPKVGTWSLPGLLKI
jgi:hypothetical protein